MRAEYGLGLRNIEWINRLSRDCATPLETPQGVALKCWYFGCYGLHFLDLAVAVQREVAASYDCTLRPVADAARKGVHRQIIAHQKAGKTDLLSNNILQHT